jgi:uncharacterized protein YkwD
MNSCKPCRLFPDIILLITILLGVACSKKSVPEKTVETPRPPVIMVSTVDMSVDILNYVNQHRRSKGLVAVQLNSVESAVALQHSKNMAAGRTPFGHKGLELRMNTISRQIGPLTATAENVAFGQMSAKDVVESWLHSPNHRKNIEGDFVLTGIGWAKDKKGMIYYTQIFTR